MRRTMLGGLMQAFARSDTGEYEATNEGLRKICGAYRLVHDNWMEFRGRVRASRVGTLGLADISFSPCRVIRDHCDENYLGDYYYLVFQAEGSACMRQLGSDALLRPGDCTLIDSRYPSVFEYPSELRSPHGFRQYSFHLAAELFEERLVNRRVPVAQVIHGDRGAGRLLADSLTSMLRNAPELGDVQLTDVILHLVTAAIGVQNGHQGVDERRCGVGAEDIRRHIAANIQNHDLSPQIIAEHFGISARHLYRLIAPTGYTPAALIWRNRLERARALLTQKDLRTPIIEIALSSGFKDPAHFSRAYRKAFGHPPKISRRAPAPMRTDEPLSSITPTS